MDPSDGKIVRLLFGAPEKRLLCEVEEALSCSWYAENVHHYAAGGSNFETLRKAGARHVTLVDKNPYVNPKFGRGYAKSCLLRRAIEDHGEILYLDFDCYEWKSPDSEMWSILRGGAEFQAMRIIYLIGSDHNEGRVVPINGERERLNITLRLRFSTCAVYCRDPAWVSRWMESYKALAYKSLTFLDGNNEVALMYSLEHHFGVAEAVRRMPEWECGVVLIDKRQAVKKSESSVHFVHKRHKKDGLVKTRWLSV